MPKINVIVAQFVSIHLIKYNVIFFNLVLISNYYLTKKSKYSDFKLLWFVYYIKQKLVGNQATFEVNY